jgi:transposase-like protein
MSQKEFHRLEAVQKVKDDRLSVSNAARLLSISRSHMHRLLQAYDREGSGGLVSKKRGRPSNRRYPEAFRNTVLDIVREHYHDFGPTLACEKLAERHGIGISKETLRQWMTQAGLWTSRQERRKRLHQPRNRRECFGELVQIDGSHHWWFEDRGPKCALLVFIDDATGKLLHLRFARSENTFDYFHATKAYLQEWGKPLAFYSDKHGIFRTTHASNLDRTSGFTQFGRALHELNIDIICANTPHDRGGEQLCACVHCRFQRALWQGAAQSQGHAPPPRRLREPRWCHVPQGNAQAVADTDAALRQGAVHP